MKKVKLSLDDLKVESFEVAAATPGSDGGTVEGQFSTFISCTPFLSGCSTCVTCNNETTCSQPTCTQEDTCGAEDTCAEMCEETVSSDTCFTSCTPCT
jgi:hypothetical protein